MKNKDENILLSGDWKSAVDENIRCGLIELLILSMIANKDMYTYEIKQALLVKSNGSFQLRDGSMYGPMYRMLERKLISVRQEMVGEKRFRNYYHLEESGKEYLAFSIEKFHEIYGITDAIISEYTPKKQEQQNNNKED